MSIAWKKWLAGLWAAGSSGAMTALTTSLLAPDQFNIYTRKFWICAGASSTLSGVKYIWRTRLQVSTTGKLEPEETDATAASAPPTKP